MKRNLWYSLICLGTIFVGYSVLMFLFAKLSAIFSVSYVMTTCAFVITALVLNYFFAKKQTARTQYHIGALLRYSIIYVVAQLLTSVMIVGLQNYFNVAVVIAIYTILLVVFVCLATMAKAGEEFINRQDPINVRLKSVIKECQMRIDMMRLQCQDQTLCEALNELSEEFRYSDPTTAEAISVQDSELETFVQCLEVLCTTDRTAAFAHIKLIKNKLYLRNQMYKQRKG